MIMYRFVGTQIGSMYPFIPLIILSYNAKEAGAFRHRLPGLADNYRIFIRYVPAFLHA